MNLTTLSLSFWDYSLDSATCILNMIPTKKVDKTPYELWIPKGNNGYYFYFPHKNKIVVARYAKFLEKNLISREANRRAMKLEEIQYEDTSPSENTRENHVEPEGFELPQEDIALLRRTKRIHRAPERLCLNVEVEEHSLGDLNEPIDYKVALLDPKFNKWLDAMNAKMQSMKDNKVWRLVDLPPNGNIVGSKWLFKKRPTWMAIHLAIRILIAIAALCEYEIWKMDVKTAFLMVILIKISIWYNLKVLLIIFKDPFIDLNKHQEVGIKALMRKSKRNNIPMLQSVKSYLGKCFAIITDIRYVLTQRALTIFCEMYHIRDEVHPQLPSPNQTIHEMPSGKIGVYTKFFEYANFRLPLSTFFVNVLKYYHIHISQLSVIGAVKVSHFERPGSDAVCYTKPLDSLKKWNDCFFWVYAFACPTTFPWNTSKGVPKDPFLKSSEFNSEHFATLVALPAPFHKYLESFLCLVGISRYYTLDEDVYPEFLGDNDEGMDLLAFIRTADPTKVSVAERQHAENKPRLLESIVGRVVPLLPISPAHASSELEASVNKIFDEGASKDGQGADIQPVAVTTDTIVEDVAPMQPRRQRKRKTDVVDDVGPSHPPKKYVISSDSSHHSGANITEAEVDSIVRSSASAIVTVTTVTAVIDADATAARAPVAPSLFGVSSSSTGRTDSVPGGFSNVSGSDFLIGGIRTVVDPDSDLQKVYKRKLRAVVDEPAELLKAKDGEIESLKAQLLLKERKPRRLSVFGLRSLNLKLGSNLFGVADLDAQVTAVKLQNDNLVGQISSVGLEEKVDAYEDFVGQLEKFQDEKLEEGPRLARLLRRVCRKDYLRKNVNFPLIAELKSNKDASVDTIMNLLRLDDVLAERLGLTESQPHVNQLMVPIHQSSNQRVVGAFALSLSLEVSHSRVKKIRENIAKHVSDLCGVFVPLSEPLSSAALDGMEGGVGVDDETAAVDNMNLFFDVSNAELNILESLPLRSELAFVFRMACFVVSVYKISWTKAGALNPDVVISFHFGFVPCFLNCSLLSLFLQEVQTDAKASLFLAMSTFAVLKVGMRISAGNTASAP
nr:hypothetical protein [Tanacetum cinerariifolium]